MVGKISTTIQATCGIFSTRKARRLTRACANGRPTHNGSSTPKLSGPPPGCLTSPKISLVLPGKSCIGSRPLTSGASLHCHHTDIQCKYCQCGALEIVEHCFWECETSQPIWTWVSKPAPSMTFDSDQLIHLTIGQALIGEPLSTHCSIPKKWWHLLHLIALWFIWISHIQVTFKKKACPPIITKSRAWHQIQTSLKAQWANRILRRQLDDRKENKACYLFEFD